MIRDPFYRQIIDRLDGTVDPELFEQCAADLLREIYPTLVPIRGGADAGMDGAIADALGEPYPLVCTVGKDVLGNLTRSLKSYLKEGGKRRKVVLATSQSLTPKRKANLSDRARELGFALIQVHDQAAMADLLYRNSKWCLELLGLSGNPPALSAIPKTNRPILNKELVGRDLDLAWLRMSDGDKLLIGQPGSGKTFLLLNLLEDGALFVVSKDRAAIATGIRDEMPETIIVDDAGVNPEVISDLKQIREEIGAQFSILASCWPGDQDNVNQILSLPASDVHSLGPLTRDEIVDVVKTAGLVGPDGLIHEIVNQAEGRPGLAATLAYLALRGGAKEVAFGETLFEWIRSVSDVMAGRTTVEVLAAFSVGGRSGMPMHLVANELKLSPVEVRQIVTDLAAAGIIDEVGDQWIAVRPAALRFVLVRDVFFKGAASLSIDSLLAQAPNLTEAVLTIVGARARGATIPQHFLTGLLEKINSDEIWIQYAGLGQDETVWILQHYPGKVVGIALPALHRAPDITIPLLLQNAVGNNRELHATPEHPLRLINDWAHSGYPESWEGVRRRITLFECARSWLSEGNDIQVGLVALATALSPVFEDTTTDPGMGTTLTISRGFLTQEELAEIHSLWACSLEIIKSIEVSDWKSIQWAIEDWAYPGQVGSLPTALSDMMRATAGEMLRDLVALVEARPGVLQWARELAKNIDVPVGDIRIDADFEILHPSGNAMDIHTSESAHVRTVSELADEWCNLDATRVAEKIGRIEREAEAVGRHWPNFTPLLCEEIARRVVSPILWAKALVKTGAAGDLITPFLRQGATLDEEGWSQLAANCLKEPRLTLSIVSLVLTLNSPPEDLLKQALQNMDRAANLTNFHCLRNEVAEEIVSHLLQHQNPDIATAAALGIWQAEPYGDVPTDLIAEWRVVIQNTTSDDFWLGEVLKKDSSLSFEWLQRRLSEPFLGLFRLDKAIEAAIDSLSLEQRHMILQQLDTRQPSILMVQRLVGDNLALYSTILRDNGLKSLHLMPLPGAPEGIWLDKATLALDSGYDSEYIANATFPQYWSWFGEQSGMWAQWIAQFDRLLVHKDERIQAVGELGKTRAEAARDKALTSEREEAIQGIRDR